MIGDLSKILTRTARLAAQLVLWTPRRFAVTVAVLILAVVAAGSLTGGGRRREAAPAAASTSSVPTAVPPPVVVPPPAPTTPIVVEPTPSTVHVATNAAAVRAGYGFAHAWIDTGGTPADWLARMAPFTTTALLTDLGTSDPGNVPCSTITGPASQGVTADGMVQVLVPADCTRIDLTVTAENGAWRVADVNVIGT